MVTTVTADTDEGVSLGHGTAGCGNLFRDSTRSCKYKMECELYIGITK